MGHGTRKRLAMARNWATWICGSSNWAMARKRLRTTEVDQLTNTLILNFTVQLEKFTSTATTAAKQQKLSYAA